MTILFVAASPPGAEIAREGLPTWIFYLLLSLILLLVVFIFLRDRDLRERLDAFFSGAKKRVQRARLRNRLRREKRRRTETLAELGRKAWAARLPGEAYESFHANLALLEKDGSAKQAELQSIVSRALDLRKRHEEARRMAKRAKNPGISEEGAAGPDSREFRIEERRLKKDIAACEKEIRSGQAYLRSVEQRKREQFIELGNLVDLSRPESQDFVGLYVQVDKHNRNILHYMNEIEKFR
jgi:hypothetical protein